MGSGDFEAPAALEEEAKAGKPQVRSRCVKVQLTSNPGRLNIGFFLPEGFSGIHFLVIQRHTSNMTVSLLLGHDKGGTDKN